MYNEKTCGPRRRRFRASLGAHYVVLVLCIACLVLYPTRTSSPTVVVLVAWSFFCTVLVILSLFAAWPFGMNTVNSQLVAYT